MASRFNRSYWSYTTYVFSLVLLCGSVALGQTPDCSELKTRLDRAETRLKDWPALARYREDNKKTPTPPKNEQRVVFRQIHPPQV